MRLLEGQKSVDISETGFQQYDLADSFDMFENPHGLEGDTDEKARLLYQVASSLINILVEQTLQTVRGTLLAR